MHAVSFEQSDRILIIEFVGVNVSVILDTGINCEDFDSQNRRCQYVNYVMSSYANYHEKSPICVIR